MKNFNKLLYITTFALLTIGLNGQMVPELLYYQFDGVGTSVPDYASAPIGNNPATIIGGLTQGGTQGCSGSAGLIGIGAPGNTNSVQTGANIGSLGSGDWTIMVGLNSPITTTTLHYIFGQSNASSFRCFTGGVAGPGNLWLRGPVTDVPAAGGAAVGYHVTHYVHDDAANEIRAYVDGVLVNTIGNNPTITAPDNTFLVGGYSGSNGIINGGTMDEFRIYNRALDQAEITATWNVCPLGGPPPPAPLTLKSVAQGDDELRTIDPATGATLSSVTMTLAGSSINGGNGLATHPTSGELYAILRIGGGQFNGRALVTIDPMTGVATLVGDTQESFAGIAFDCDGTLYGVTGDGGNVPETLFTISTLDGTPTLVCALGNGNDGEALGFNPNDGLLYHASGHTGSNVIFETISNTGIDPCGVTNIDISGTLLEDEEAQALTWDPINNVFLWKQDHGTGPLYSVTPGGVATLLGGMDHQAKGLAFCGGASVCEESECMTSVTNETTTYSFTGAPQQFVVPAGVSSIFIETWGASGGGGGFGANVGVGGEGGFSSGTLTVSPGDVLEIYVGGQGTPNTTAGCGNGGFNGGGCANGTSTANVRGGGGGASDVRLNGSNFNDRMIVAGGGGGACCATGGDGGGLMGEAGILFPAGVGGGGGTQTMGGIHACPGCCYEDGAFGLGGASGVGCFNTGAGGGGGWYGGGAGNDAGGGSGYIGGVTGGITTVGGNVGDGLVIFTYQGIIQTGEGCCSPDAGSQTENSGLCVDDSGVAPAGATVAIDVDFTDIANQPIAGVYNYGFFIADPSGIILSYVPSLNYEVNQPASFTEDLDISGLALGQYCVHGISYLDGDNPFNDDVEDFLLLDLAFLESLAAQGGNVSALTGILYEINGVVTDNEPAYCADVNLAGCTVVSINPTPVFVTVPMNQYICGTTTIALSASATVAAMGPPSGVTSALVFYLQERSGAGWQTIDTNSDDQGGVPGAVVTADFEVIVAGDQMCNTFRIVVEAQHDPEPLCEAITDNILVISYQQGSLTCNSSVNMSLTSQCAGNFNAISFLEGEEGMICGIGSEEFYDNFFTVYYLLPDGTRLTENDDISFLAGSCVDFEVEDICFNITCWGEVCIEDKLDPVFATCQCPVQGSIDREDYPEDCRLKCYQRDLIQDGIEGAVNTNACNYLPFPTTDDNCINYPPSWTNPAIGYADEWIDGDCGQSWLRRTYQLFHQRRNETTGALETYVADECVYEFFVDAYSVEPQDVIGLETIDDFIAITDEEILRNSLFLPVAYIELSCGANIDPEVLASLSGFDQAGNPAPSGDFGSTPGIEESNEGIPFAYPFYMGEGQACRLHPQRIAPDVCNIIADYTDTVLESCGFDCFGNRKTLRDWTILDWCAGEVIYWQQLFKAVDNTPPTLAVLDITVSVDPWNCSADALLPAPEFMHDDCDDKYLSYSVGNLQGIQISGDGNTGYVAHDLQKTMPGNEYSFRYEVSDCCGNVGFAFMTVTVVDLTAPVPVTLENIVISITTLNPDTSGIGKIFTDDIDNGSYDACGPVHLEIRRATDNCGIVGNATFNNDGHAEDDDNDPDGGQSVKFCCDDLEDDGTGLMVGFVDVVLRVWDDADMDGSFGSAGDNYNESWSTIRVEDKLGGSPQCPANVILSCEYDKDNIDNTGAPGPSINTCTTSPVDSLYTDVFKRKNATDAPELNPIVGPVVQPFDPVCRVGAVERSWNAGCTQWIIFVDNGEQFDWESIVYPDDFIVDCEEFDAGEPTWSPVSCHLIGYSIESDTFNFEQGACLKVLNHYTIIDWCEYNPQEPQEGGIWSWTQTIKLIDTDDPTVEYTGEACFAVNVDCESDDIELTMVGDDEGECPSPWLKWEVQVDLWGDGTLDHAYSTNLPVSDPYYIAPSARGAEVSVTLPAGVDVSKNDHYVYITVSDGCGNVTSLVETIEIIDKKKPTPYCLNLSTAFMSNGQVELWACDFNAGSFDNCTPDNWLRYTFSAVNPDTLNDTPNIDETYDEDARCSGRIFTPSDLANDTDGDGLIEVEVYVWDECGNYDFCIVNLRLIDNQSRASVEGNIRTETGNNVKDVAVSIHAVMPEYPENTMTDASGHYAFADNPMFMDYSLEGHKNDDFLNGVSTLDLVLMQRHILGLRDLDSAYKLIAADINSDARVSTIDLIELRKLILGIYEELPQNESWRFAIASQQMDIENPWNFVEEISITELAADMMSEDYVGIKIGDVNSSVELGLRGEESEGRSKSLELIIGTQSYKAGAAFRMEVRSSNFEDVSGYQFTLEQNGLVLQSVESGVLDMSSQNVAQLDAETITVSWNTERGMSAEDSEVLFTLVFEAESSGSTESIKITSNKTKAEAYKGSINETIGVSLRGAEDVLVTKLYQNEPNPFGSVTQIAFELSKAGTATLSITDVTGKQVKLIEGSYDAGMNVIELNSNELGASGVLYYTLESGDFVATKKMVVIK